MAVATSSSRPLSLFQPSSDQLAPLRRPRSPPTSHYRPFSIHITDTPTSEPRRRSLIRPPSFASMGFHFKDRTREKEKQKEKEKEKTKAKEKEEKKPSHSLQSFQTSPNRSRPYANAVGSPSHLPKHQHLPDRPSTSLGLFTLPRDKGLKKKRSLSSLLSAASESSLTGSTVSSRSGSQSPEYPPHARSPPSASDSAQLSPVDENLVKDDATDDATIKAPPGRGTRRPRRRPTNNFVRKNTWLRRQNMKVHPYPLEATYMQAYEPLQLENDRYTDILLRRLNPLDSPSFHNYGRKIPLYALDLGCGPGHWLLDASNAWTTSQVTGFDLVDTLLPEVHKQDNIQFVRGNFLKYPLPFADKSFDLVRMANLSLCIPYDKWEFVFSEVQRVLTIDGRLELIDDQIFFPYGQAPAIPVSTPVSTSSTPVKSSRDSCWFDDDDDDTLADDSTGDGHSMETDSTLISDADLSSSSHDKPKNHNPMLRETPLMARSQSFDASDPSSPKDAQVHESVITGPSPWSTEVKASRNLETVFQNMLNHKFGTHTRPSDFVADMMKHVFGNGRKMKSFHLKLAPRDSYTNLGSSSSISSGGSVEAVAEKEERMIRINSKVSTQKLSEFTKPWFTVEWDNDEGKKMKRERKADGYRRFAEEEFRPRIHIPDATIPEGLSAKAAGRLGISGSLKRPSIPQQVHGLPSERLVIPKLREHKVGLGHGATPSIPEEPAEPSTDDDLIDPMLTGTWTKAGRRLSNSQLPVNGTTKTSAHNRRPQSYSSLSSTSSATSQSPGLLLWPSTFLPLPPSELEMHACKHIHTLLGCKPALAEYIETCTDEHGARLLSDDEFHEAIWDYECFRRRRFHWPSEIPESDQDDLEDSWDAIFTPRPNASTLKPATSRTSTGSNSEVSSVLSVDILSSSTRPYTVDELAHARTIRVFEAVKTKECTLASLQFPRSPSPIPSPQTQ